MSFESTADRRRLASVRNREFISLLEAGHEKTAQAGMIEYTRVMNREDSFMGLIMGMIPADPSMFARDVSNHRPYIVVDLEARTPGAISGGTGMSPQSDVYVQADRYAVPFDRSMTPRFAIDIMDLWTWHMDIREVVTNNAIKDLVASRDTAFMAKVDFVVGSKNAAPAYSNVPQWVGLSGGISRETIKEGRKQMPRISSRLEPTTMLFNNVTVHDFGAWGRDEMGGGLSEKFMIDGVVLSKLQGVNTVVTMKHVLVPEGTIYYFADPKYIGKSYKLNDPTLEIKKEGPRMSWYAMEETGCAIGHFHGIVRVDHEGG